MKHKDVFRIAHKGYQEAANDGGILRLIDEETGEPDTDGDSLARAIITELAEGVEETDAEDDPHGVAMLEEAFISMRKHRDLLDGIMLALEDELQTRWHLWLEEDQSAALAWEEQSSR